MVNVKLHRWFSFHLTSSSTRPCYRRRMLGQPIILYRQQYTVRKYTFIRRMLICGALNFLGMNVTPISKGFERVLCFMH